MDGWKNGWINSHSDHFPRPQHSYFNSQTLILKSTFLPRISLNILNTNIQQCISTHTHTQNRLPSSSYFIHPLFSTSNLLLGVICRQTLLASTQTGMTVSLIQLKRIVSECVGAGKRVQAGADYSVIFISCCISERSRLSFCSACLRVCLHFCFTLKRSCCFSNQLFCY